MDNIPNYNLEQFFITMFYFVGSYVIGLIMLFVTDWYLKYKRTGKL